SNLVGCITGTSSGLYPSQGQLWGRATNGADRAKQDGTLHQLAHVKVSIRLNVVFARDRTPQSHLFADAGLQPFWLLRWRLWPVLAVSGPSHRTEPSTLLGNGLESRRKLLRHVLNKDARRRRHTQPTC